MFRTIIATGILILMVSVLSGVLVYRYEEDKHQAERLVMQQQIDDLSLQVLQFQEAMKLTDELQKCAELNADPAHAVVQYSNPDRGITVQLPYNERWGYGENLPEPYQELSGIDGILFGPPQEMGQCQWAHMYQLTFLPARTWEDIEKDLLERASARLEDGNLSEEDVLPTTYDASEFSAATYSVQGFCTSRNIEIIGTEYNYIFTACQGDDAELDTVVQSVELL